MSVWAIVPVKPFNRAKSRLTPVLSPEERSELAQSMFKHALEVLVGIKTITGVLVISRDTKALSEARDMGAHTVQESGTPELNSALLRACQVVGIQGATAVLILPADLPTVNATDIEQMVHLGRYNTTIVLAPDRNEDGTNALFVRPPGFIPFSYGPGSFQRHMGLAERANATVKIYRSATLGLDIDTPADLLTYYNQIGHPLPLALQNGTHVNGSNGHAQHVDGTLHVTKLPETGVTDPN